jgi:hypothetical protein
MPLPSACWATPRRDVPAPGMKVFWFFFSKKNPSSFSEEKEAKRLLFLCCSKL